MIFKRTIERYRRNKENDRIWAEHGNETRFHLTDSRLDIGEFTYGIPEICYYDDRIRLKIGKFCSIADNVKIHLGGGHHTDWVSTYPFFRDPKNFPTTPSRERDCILKDVIIGNDVWIGSNVVVLSGVTIGDGAVIGAGAVVSKDIPPYAIAYGCPIKIVKYRFPLEMIDRIMATKWWDLPLETINALLPSMADPEEFLARYSELREASRGEKK